MPGNFLSFWKQARGFRNYGICIGEYLMAEICKYRFIVYSYQKGEDPGQLVLKKLTDDPIPFSSDSATKEILQKQCKYVFLGITTNKGNEQTDYVNGLMKKKDVLIAMDGAGNLLDMKKTTCDQGIAQNDIIHLLINQYDIPPDLVINQLRGYIKKQPNASFDDLLKDF
jgi:hypothetical protein